MTWAKVSGIYAPVEEFSPTLANVCVIAVKHTRFRVFRCASVTQAGRASLAVFLRWGFKRRPNDDDLYRICKREAHCWAIYFVSRFETHQQRYQKCVAPAVTLLFCLRVTSLKSLICSLSIRSLVVDIRVSDFTGLDRPPRLWHSGQRDPKCACFLSGGRGGASSSLFRCCFCQ